MSRSLGRARVSDSPKLDIEAARWVRITFVRNGEIVGTALVRRTTRCMLCCMSATRTQVYLSEEQRRRIDAVVEAEGVTLAEVVRRALDLYLAEAHPDAGPALAATFGADPDAEYPDRDQWDRA